MIHEIDAKGKSLGRVASEVASVLRGKNKPSFQPNIAPETEVKILNVDKIKLTGNKLKEKTYKRYSGYPGNLKTVSFESSFKKDPERVFRKTVERMLPNNRLRSILLKNLKFEQK